MKLGVKLAVMLVTLACVVGCASTSTIAVPEDGFNIHLIDANGTITGFDKIQSALDAIGNTEGEFTILLEKGTYSEIFINYNGPANITFKGNTNAKYGAKYDFSQKVTGNLNLYARFELDGADIANRISKGIMKSIVKVYIFCI